MNELAEKARRLRRDLLADMDRDAAAYTAVMEAFRLPRETAEEKSHRTEAIQQAIREAARVPLAVAEKALDVMMLAGTAVAKGNPNAISDGAVGAMLLAAWRPWRDRWIVLGILLALTADPNDIAGPPGVGEPRWVVPWQRFGYQVDFENIPEATAPAQRVTVTVDLDPAFDLDTFRFGDGQVAHITCSIGFTCYPAGSAEMLGLSLEQVVSLADKALYSAKKAGRNAWVGLLGTSSTSIESVLETLQTDPDTAPQEGVFEVRRSADRAVARLAV